MSISISGDSGGWGGGWDMTESAAHGINEQRSDHFQSQSELSPRTSRRAKIISELNC